MALTIRSDYSCPSHVPDNLNSPREQGVARRFTPIKGSFFLTEVMDTWQRLQTQTVALRVQVSLTWGHGPLGNEDSAASQV